MLTKISPFEGKKNHDSYFVQKNCKSLFRYYRSGAEMVKMAETYCEEETYEKAYILYLKYLTLFIEKVRKLMMMKLSSFIT